MTDIRTYNREAWNEAVARRSAWTVPVGTDVISSARAGNWQIVLTPTMPVPRDWFPEDLANVDTLCLASGGGQQGPILAAAGSNITVLDNSPRQLTQDRYVAERDDLTIRTVEGDMADLSIFADEAFDLVVHPCSNMFVPDLGPVWREAYRVLRSGGYLLSGFTNPALYIFDQQLLDDGVLQVRHTLPYSDLTSLTEAERQRYMEDLQPLEFGHTLEEQIGGQLRAGFVITGFYEDTWPGMVLAEYMQVFLATRAQKPTST